MRSKEGNLFKLLFREVGVVISAKHISSSPKGEFSSTVELQIGGAAAPEWVWWSRSPAKHALKGCNNLDADDSFIRKGSHLEQRQKLGLVNHLSRSNAPEFSSEHTSAFDKVEVLWILMQVLVMMKSLCV
jgi:hypothetical protein